LDTHKQGEDKEQIKQRTLSLIWIYNDQRVRWEMKCLDSLKLQTCRAENGMKNTRNTGKTILILTQPANHPIIMTRKRFHNLVDHCLK